jgi:hypothetical protein
MCFNKKPSAVSQVQCTVSSLFFHFHVVRQILVNYQGLSFVITIIKYLGANSLSTWIVRNSPIYSLLLFISELFKNSNRKLTTVEL